MFFTQQNLGQSYGNAPGIMRYLSFAIAFNDAGAGSVNTTPDYNLGSGTATFTRNTTAYALLSNGNYGSVASGTARGSYNASGAWLGFQAEGARADVLGTTTAIRRTMTDVGWVSGGGGITVGAATGIDGVGSAGASLTAGGANGTILFTTVLGAAVRTFSAWVRRKTGTGTVNITGDNGATWTAMTLTTTYTQFQFTTASAANPVVGFRIVTDTDAIEVDFNTLEAAPIANPTPIPVNVSKAADLLTYPVNGNIIGTTGTISAEFTSKRVGSGVAAQGVTMAVINRQLINIEGGGNGTLRFYDGTNIDDWSGITYSSSSVFKIAVAYSGTTVNAVKDGALLSPAQTFDGDLNIAGDDIKIGSGGELFGTVKNVKIFNQALSALQLSVLIP